MPGSGWVWLGVGWCGDGRSLWRAWSSCAWAGNASPKRKRLIEAGPCPNPIVCAGDEGFRGSCLVHMHTPRTAAWIPWPQAGATASGLQSTYTSTYVYLHFYLPLPTPHRCETDPPLFSAPGLSPSEALNTVNKATNFCNPSELLGTIPGFHGRNQYTRYAA